MDNTLNVECDKIVCSPHTNRPISDYSISSPPIFWCETCCIKLTSPTVAIQHLNGRSHKAKINAVQKLQPQNDLCDLARLKNAFQALHIQKSTGPFPQALPTKKSKGTGNQSKTNETVVQNNTGQKNKEHNKLSDPNLTCEDCDLVFDSAVIAIQHLKGKRHIAKIAAKLATKQKISYQLSMRGGQGGRGRDNFLGKGYGSMGPSKSFCVNNDFDPLRYNYFFNQHNQSRNNYAMRDDGFFRNSSSNYRTSQHDDHDEKYSYVNGDSPQGLLLSNDCYFDFDNISSESAKLSRNNNKKYQNIQRGGGKLPISRGRGIPNNPSMQGYTTGGYGSSSPFGNSVGRGNPYNSNWWCKNFVKCTSMKGTT